MKITDKKIQDSLLAYLLICLLVFILTQKLIFIYIAICLLLLGMTIPKIFKYPAIFWFQFAQIISKVNGFILISYVYFLVLLPLSLIRKLLRIHPDLKIKHWNKDKQSSFITRDHEYTKEDFERLF